LGSALRQDQMQDFFAAKNADGDFRLCPFPNRSLGKRKLKNFRLRLSEYNKNDTNFTL